MGSMISSVAGGIGLFLLGMILMTDGLKALAGDSLRRLLARFAGGPVSAMLSGAGATALVQSSHATTLATIGFVSAGLLSFQQALGVILGANLGTTSTGWLVSLLGLKLSIGKLAMPLICLGALARLVARGKVAQAGLALCGFGVIFVGLDLLQGGMGQVATRFDPTRLPDDSVSGRLLLVLIGLGMTVIVQSSSAAVAATLTALSSGAINLDQAAAMVIGQNVGTSLTAAVAAIGASVPAKRTALAHILFNVLTGVVAFMVLPLLAHGVEAAAHGFGTKDDAIALAAFHSAFNVLGIAIFLPMTGPFARLIERLIREKQGQLARHLDSSVADLPGVSVEAARRALLEISGQAVARIRQALVGACKFDALGVDMTEWTDALTRTRAFIARVGRLENSHEQYRQHVSNLHATDHLDRLLAVLREPAALKALSGDERLAPFLKLAQEAATQAAWMSDVARKADAAPLAAASRVLADLRRAERPRIMEQTASGECASEHALELLEGMHWLDRLTYHIWRIGHHLSGAALAVEPEHVADASPGA
ncbi:MAG: hypothetical protein HPKKFMNG_01711 [Planctomycetes bacterium]|nr:hypothetical protein [Planctomycetota bacterium]